MENAGLFRVCTKAVKRVKVGIKPHKLAKDSVSGCKYNNAVTFTKQITGVLEDEYFENTTDGMKGLISENPNELTGFKANVAVTKADVKAALIAAAAIGGNAAPEITTNEDAQEEANRQNVFRLAVVGSKEHMAKEITARVGKSITNPILRNADRV